MWRRLAYQRIGSGPPLVLVSGSLQPGATFGPLAEELANRVTAITYDRRGRGSSGHTPPYSVEREVEDLSAIIDAAGANASVYGHSSGAALVLHAAARGMPMDRIVLHEPPFGAGTEEEARAECEEAGQIAALLADDRRSDAVAFYLGGMGLPPELVEHVSHDPAIVANAHTLLHDPFETMSARSRGGRTPADQASTVTRPALVIAGGASPDWMIDASRLIADALPNGRLEVLPDQEHVVPPAVLAPVLVEFIGAHPSPTGDHEQVGRAVGD